VYERKLGWVRDLYTTVDVVSDGIRAIGIMLTRRLGGKLELKLRFRLAETIQHKDTQKLAS
jgi:hypothetical protein